MFHFFKTSIDFNLWSSPKGWLFEHLIGDEYGLRICPFGRIAIFALIFIIMGRDYFELPKNVVIFALCVSFLLSFMNLNAVVYLLPVWLVELYYMLK
jgi:hypothetical protein